VVVEDRLHLCVLVIESLSTLVGQQKIFVEERLHEHIFGPRSFAKR
jgi:hypothetical protein